VGALTEHSVKGGLIVAAFTIGGAVLFGVVGLKAMAFVGQWLWVPPAGPNIPKGIDGPTWGELFIAEWLWGLTGGPSTAIDPYARFNFAKGIYVATYALGGVVGGVALGGAMGAWLALRCLSRTKDP
jgi:hypothetical protein